MGSREYALEDIPTLRVQHLRHSRMFATSYKSSVAIKHHIPYSVTYEAGQDLITIEFIHNDEYCCQYIDLAKSRAGFGDRTYFICPVMRNRCSVLYLCQGRFVSRKAISGLSVRGGSPSEREYQRLSDLRARIMGADGRKPARGRRRGELFAELEQHDWTTDVWPELATEEDSNRVSHNAGCRDASRPGWRFHVGGRTLSSLWQLSTQSGHLR